MTETEHIELIKQESAGNVLVGIDRIFARRFYTDTSLKSIESATGEAPYMAKLIVFACYLGSPLLLLVSIALSFIYFGWWGLMFAPVCFGYWFVIYSSSSRGTSGMSVVSFLLACAIVVLIGEFIPESSAILLCSITGASFFARFLYVSSTFQLRLFVIRNYKAYNLAVDGITLKHS